MQNGNGVAHATRRLGSVIGNGILAGLAGTAAITLSQLIEMRMSRRRAGKAPVHAAEEQAAEEGVQGIEQYSPEAEEEPTRKVHWAYGTSWGVTRGLLYLAGIRGLKATTLHFAAIQSTAMVTEPALQISPPVRKWDSRTITTDALHHAVYSVVTGWIFDALMKEPTGD